MDDDVKSFETWEGEGVQYVLTRADYGLDLPQIKWQLDDCDAIITPDLAEAWS